MNPLPYSSSRIADGLDLRVECLAIAQAVAPGSAPVLLQNAPRHVYMELFLDGDSIERAPLHRVEGTITPAAKLAAYEVARQFLNSERSEISLIAFELLEWSDSDGDL